MTVVSEQKATYTIYIDVDIWVTDVTYLSTFRKWCKGCTFLPLEGVSVSIVETQKQAPTLPQNSCAECKKKWEGSGLKEMMEKAEWAMLRSW